METNQFSAQNFLKTIGIIHLALILGQFSFLMVVLFVLERGDDDSMENIFWAISIIGLISGIFIGKFIFAKLKMKAIASETLKEKLMGFQAAIIVRYALLEAPAFISIIATMITGNLYFIGIALVTITVFILLRPSKDFVAKHLNLSNDEIKEIANNEYK